MRRAWWCLIALGCNAPRGEMAEPTTSSSSTGAATTSTTSSTGGESSSEGDTTLGLPSGHFGLPDVGPDHRCSQWAQDCPPGQKCTPYADDGGSSWNSTHCAPIADDPKQPGEACSVEGSGVSGIDDCDRAAMCWGVDPETDVGTCVAMCHGSEANPSCTDPCTFCSIAGEGVLTLCLPNCDPVTQNCAYGQACYPIGDSFACAPDTSGDVGAPGDACESINVCDLGSGCVNPEFVPGCDGPGCCAPFCDASGPDDCDALLPGTQCVPWFDPGGGVDACLTTGMVGICRLP